jgi:hypothetical protein
MEARVQACVPAALLRRAQNYGTQAALKRLYNGHKECVCGVLIERINQYAQQHPEKSAATLATYERVVRMTSLTSDLPRLARMMPDYAVNRPRFRVMIEEVIAVPAREDGNPALPGDALIARLDAHIEGNLLDASPRWIWALFAVNVVAMLAASAWLR